MMAESVRLTYGQQGPERPDHRVLPGEDVHMEYVARGIGHDAKGEVDLTIAGELVDREGRKIREALPIPSKGRSYAGPSMYVSSVGFELAPDLTPGEYHIRAILSDKITGRVMNFEHPLFVTRPEFGVVRLRLTHDKEGRLPAGGQITAGQQIYIRGRLVNYARDGERIHVSIKVSVLGPDGTDGTPTPIAPIAFDGNWEASKNVNFERPLQSIQAGKTRIVIEVEDLIGEKKARYEMPVLIHPLRSTPIGKEP